MSTSDKQAKALKSASQPPLSPKSGSCAILGFKFDAVEQVWQHPRFKPELIAEVVAWLDEDCIGLESLRGKPASSFVRTLEALGERFPKPLGLLTAMEESITGPIERAKADKKRKSEAKDSADKPSKKKADAMSKAAQAMHAELINHGVLVKADYHKLTWAEWKDQNAEALDDIVAARHNVLQKKGLQENRLDAVRILATHWRNQRKLYNSKKREQVNESPATSPAKSSDGAGNHDHGASPAKSSVSNTSEESGAEK